MSPTMLVFVNRLGFAVPPRGEIPEVMVYAPPFVVADQRRFSDESMLNEKDMLFTPSRPWQLCVCGLSENKWREEDGFSDYGLDANLPIVGEGCR